MESLRCQDVEFLIQDYLEGYLLPSQRELLENHVRNCESCRTLLQDIRRLDDELEGLPEVESPGGLSGRILDAIPEMVREETSRRRQVFTFAGALAAAALIFSTGFLYHSREATLPQDPVREIEVVFLAPEAESVALVGDFNGWDPAEKPMSPFGGEGLWRARLKLPLGMYQYGFVIDGRLWTNDPQAESFLADGFGGKNSVLFVDG